MRRQLPPTEQTAPRRGRGISRVLVVERCERDFERIARMVRERDRAVVLDVQARGRARGRAER